MAFAIAVRWKAAYPLDVDKKNINPGSTERPMIDLLIFEPSLIKKTKAIGAEINIRNAKTVEEVASAAFTKTGVTPHNKTARFTANTDRV